MPSKRRQVNVRISAEDEGLLLQLQESMTPQVIGGKPATVSAVIHSALLALARDRGIKPPPEAAETRGRKKGQKGEKS